MSKYPMNASPRQVARMGIISEHALRMMIARGECPGFYTGSHFRVAVRELVKKLYGSEALKNEGQKKSRPRWADRKRRWTNEH